MQDSILKEPPHGPLPADAYGNKMARIAQAILMLADKV